MGLFTRLEKFDQKLTRGYARWGRWVWRMLIAIPVAYFLLCVGTVSYTHLTLPTTPYV